MAVTTQPYALAREEGEQLWFLGAPTRVIATAEQTGGAFGLIEQVGTARAPRRDEGGVP